MPPVKLSFGDILSDSFRFVFANLRLFFHLVTIPWIISLLIRIAGAGVSRESPLTMLFEKAADVVPTVMFMSAWMRVVLMGPQGVERLPGLGWAPRETGFLLHLIQIGGMTFLLIGAFVLTLGSIDPAALAGGQANPDLVQREAMAAPIGIGFMVSALLALRVSFGLAATAVDVPFSPRLSWAYSRGNGWTIIGALFVIYFSGALAIMMAALIPHAVIRGAFEATTGAAVIAWAIAILVSYAGLAVAATAQAMIFRSLTRWRVGVPLAPPYS